MDAVATIATCLEHRQTSDRGGHWSTVGERRGDRNLEHLLLHLLLAGSASSMVSEAVVLCRVVLATKTAVPEPLRQGMWSKRPTDTATTRRFEWGR